MPQLKKSQPQILYRNGKYTELGTKLDVELLIYPTLDLIYSKEDHKIVLDLITLTYEPGSCFWMLTFKGTGLGINDIDDIFLDSIKQAWDMDLIDQTFDHISITHNRPLKIDVIRIGIRCSE